MPSVEKYADKYAIDSHKIHLHIDKLHQWKHGDKAKLFPIYVEISPAGQCNHRCLTGDTPVNTIDGLVPIKDLVGRAHVPVYTYSQETGEVFITNAVNIRLIRNMEDIVRIWFTDGSHLDCTPDHKLLQIGLGTKMQEEFPKEAQHFINGDRVKALRLTYNEAGYAEYHWGRYGKRKRYRLIMDYLRGYKLSFKEQVHHIDRNKGNDAVSNLQYCASAKEHTLLHPEITAAMKSNNPTRNGISTEWRANLSRALRGKKRNLEQRLRYRRSKLGAKNPNYKGLPQTNRTRIKEVNHVVYKVERVPRQDVYCMEVPATGWFFANDVLVKNCTFCAVDYIGYKNRTIPADVLKRCITDMATHDVRSIMFAGEGEPLLHPELASVINHAESVGIDTAITTNGTCMNPNFILDCLHALTWIKVSCNAGTAADYARVHRTKEHDFERVWGNIKCACARKIVERAKVSIGVQAVLLPDNAEGLIELIKRARDAGVDYVVIKPYSQHKKSVTTEYKDISYKSYWPYIRTYEGMSTERTKVVVRHNAMDAWDKMDRGYKKCLSTPYFWAYIMATGDVYGCSAYLQDERFRYGNIKDKLFSEIWLGEERKRSMEYVDKELDITECRKNCRMEHVNQYLWDVSQEQEHANFI